MAIGYIEARIVSAGRGESVVGLGYYVCRRDGANPVDGRTFRYAKNSADLASLDVLLPPGAPLAYQDPAQLCAAMEARETTIDRKTGLPRFKVNAQVARHIVLALPKELSLAEQRRLACDWVGTQYVKHGVGAIVAVHHPDDPATGNGHAHIIVTTRAVTASGLGKKARHLNPAFTRAKGHARSTLHAEDLPGQWAAFQGLWFRKHGIELRVDPFQRRGGVHLGRALYVPETDAEAANKAAFEDSRRLIQDPAEALSTLTQRKAIFSRREVVGLFRRYKFSKAEIQQLTDRVLAHPDLVRLHDPETGAALPRFTTRQVREQERRILDAAEALLAAKPDRNRRNLIAAAAQARIAAMKLSPSRPRGCSTWSMAPTSGCCAASPAPASPTPSARCARRSKPAASGSSASRPRTRSPAPWPSTASPKLRPWTSNSSVKRPHASAPNLGTAIPASLSMKPPCWMPAATNASWYARRP